MKLFGALAQVFTGLTLILAWCTHIAVASQAKAWLLLIAGAIMPPIGVVHGIATWFGASWV